MLGLLLLCSLSIPFTVQADLPEAISADGLSTWLSHYQYDTHLRVLQQVVPYAVRPFPIRQYHDHETAVNNETSACHQDFSLFLLSLTDNWAIQMLDAAGKLPSGFLKGSLNWPGSFQECMDVSVPAQDKTINNRTLTTRGFQGRYCSTSWKLNVSISNVPMQLPLSIGICIPDSCNAENLKHGMQELKNYIESIKWLQNHSLPLSFEDAACKPKKAEWTGIGIFCLCLHSVFIILIVVGTVLDVLHSQQKGPSQYQTLREAAIEIANSSSIESIIPDGHVDADKEDTFSVRYQQFSQGYFAKILMCFSVYTNGKKLFNVSNLSGQLTSLHCIRFLSMCWVILGHSYSVVASFFDEPADLLKVLDKFAFQAVLQGSFSVDTFFMLSGLLLTYLFMKEITKTEGKINWFYFYAHRWWRLTPLYSVILVTYIGIVSHLGSGPFWSYNGPPDLKQCTEHWWRNLLYINNFFNLTDECMSWTWYLSNDMQFYLISPLFLWPLWKWPVVGLVIAGVLMVISWVSTFSITYVNDFSFMTDFNGAVNPESSTANYMNKIYIKPYCRIATYMVGVLLGYGLHKAEVKKIYLPKVSCAIFWLLSTALCLSVVYGLYHVHLHTLGSAFYNAFSRTAFILGVAWVAFACIQGYGGPVNALLTWRIWIPLSRLTYAAYLLHPAVMLWLYMNQQSLFHFSHELVVLLFLGFLAMSYGIAIVFSLAFEAPMMSLEKLLLNRKK